ncbi:MAG: glycosyltransferase family 2 protein [Bacteroidales bacterium]|nr:glycosyltransferase family 2 protein [Bacteroidales bacterium]
MASPRVFVAIPVMDELSSLPVTLSDLSQQTQVPDEVWMCVNQPDSWWHEPARRHICEDNQKTIALLQHFQGLTLGVIDCASPGRGWQGRKAGVGWARKTLFNKILERADAEDLIVSLDADTRVRPGYLASLLRSFSDHPEWPALSVPYYHPLSGDEPMDRAMLRYELYMRNYAVNMLRTDTPYQYTALGSAIVMRAGALRKIGGITPYQSGEDFYLLQKFCKMAPVGTTNDEMVYPATRTSDRVPFGTGPAIRQGMEGADISYPIFHHQLWEPVREATRLLPQLYHEDVDNDFLDFLKGQFQEDDLWGPIRKNVKDLPHFIHAYHEKADGLRILQYVRRSHARQPMPDVRALWENMTCWMPDRNPEWFTPEIRFQDLSVPQLDQLRHWLFEEERRQHQQKNASPR